VVLQAAAMLTVMCARAIVYKTLHSVWLPVCTTWRAQNALICMAAQHDVPHGLYRQPWQADRCCTQHRDSHHNRTYTFTQFALVRIAPEYHQWHPR
jgi:hypothetical protein